MVEVLVAALVLVVGMTATFLLIAGAATSTSAARQRDAATNLARSSAENARAIPFTQLEPGAVEAALQALPGLADAKPSVAGWQIVRRNTTFTMTAAVCNLDDPNDGLGSHDSSYCPDGPASGTKDTEPLDLRRLTVTVSWMAGRSEKTATQVAYIARTGQPDAPSVVTVAITSGSSPVTTGVASVTFSATTSRDANAVVWGVDGSTLGYATGAGTSWSFVWPISKLVDGSYVVDAQSQDGFGTPGATNGITVVLNRYAPVAPTGVLAGRNGGAVEVAWHANAERDIVGYRVYRQIGSMGKAEACPLTTALECRDLTVPDATGQRVVYTVVAVDRDPSGAPREGASSAGIDVNVANAAPAPPTNLAGTVDGNGWAKLTWTASAGDPDAGDEIRFYRIYRDGIAYESRYDRTGLGTDLTFTDTATGGTSHSYAVTAVDRYLAESPILGPVTP